MGFEFVEFLEGGQIFEVCEVHRGGGRGCGLSTEGGAVGIDQFGGRGGGGGKKGSRGREHIVAHVRALEGSTGEEDVLRRRAEGGGALDGDLALDHAGEDAQFDDIGGILVEKLGDFGARTAAQGKRFAENRTGGGEVFLGRGGEELSHDFVGLEPGRHAKNSRGFKCLLVFFGRKPERFGPAFLLLQHFQNPSVSGEVVGIPAIFLKVV